MMFHQRPLKIKSDYDGSSINPSSLSNGLLRISSGQRVSLTWLVAYCFLIASFINVSSFAIAVECKQQQTSQLVDDQVEQVEIAKVASLVCQANSSGQLISRMSTITKLDDYFSSILALDDIHTSENNVSSLLECVKKHNESLKLLRQLIATSNENVCSKDKIHLIETFHKRFVSTNSNDVEMMNEEYENNNKTPDMLKNFFMHYSLEVSAICKRNLINNLEWDVKEQLGSDEDLNLGESSPLGRLMNGVFDQFTSLSEVSDFDGVILVWDLIEGSVFGKDMVEGATSGQESHSAGRVGAKPLAVSDQPEQQVRLVVRVNNKKRIEYFQERCRLKLRPVYEKLILPIVHLANLGYSNEGAQFERELDELRHNKLVKSWYSATQLCEAVLPIVFIEDSSLAPKETAILTLEQAADLPELKEQVARLNDLHGALHYEPATNIMSNVDQLESTKLAEAQTLVAKVRLSASKRDHNVARAVKKLANDLVSNLKTKIGKIFMRTPREESGDGEKSNVDVDVSQKFSRSLNQINQSDLLKMEAGATKRSIMRQKGRKRQGDIDKEREMRTNQLSYNRTKTWSEIFESIFSPLRALAPSRLALMVAGGIIIGVLALILVVSTFSVVLAAG